MQSGCDESQHLWRVSSSYSGLSACQAQLCPMPMTAVRLATADSQKRTNHKRFDCQIIPLSSTVTDLGVRPSSDFNDHVKNLCKTYHLKNTSKLFYPDTFISLRLDYYNSPFTGITGKNIQKLKYIQNSAAKIPMNTLHPSLLHWLPVSFRIDYKVPLPCTSLSARFTYTPKPPPKPSDLQAARSSRSLFLGSTTQMKVSLETWGQHGHWTKKNVLFSFVLITKFYFILSMFCGFFGTLESVDEEYIIHKMYTYNCY